MGLISRVSSRTYRFPMVNDVRIVLDELTQHNIHQFRTINNSVLPIIYKEPFYTDALKSPIHFAKLAYFNDLVVGAVCFRLEDSSSENLGLLKLGQNVESIQNAETKRIYIMTLGTLAAYRGYGVGSKMLEWVMQRASDFGDVNGIFLHLQTNNDVAKEFYEKNGFDQHSIIPAYYKRVSPNDAYLLGKTIEPKPKSERQETSPKITQKSKVPQSNDDKNDK